MQNHIEAPVLKAAKTSFELPPGIDVSQIFEAFAGDTDRPVMLLESREVDSGAARYTKMMVNASLQLQCRGRRVEAIALDDFGRQVLALLGIQVDQNLPQIQAREETGMVTFTVPDSAASSEPIDEDERLRSVNQLDLLRSLAKLLGEDACLFGGFAFDFIETFEPVEPVESTEGDTDAEFPDYRFFLASREILIDHVEGTLTAVVWDGDGSDFFAEIGTVITELTSKNATVSLGKSQTEPRDYADSAVNSEAVSYAKPNISDRDFEDIVRLSQEHIQAGDIYQVVPSRSFAIECVNPLAAYRILRETNPSPYLFYYRDGDCLLFGSSPESCVKVEVNRVDKEAPARVSIRPIAGTMPRAILPDGSIDHEEDTRRQVRLRIDAKETAEHLMLVDLARNDIARISIPGSRRVDQLLSLELYSKVMHLVSQVTGQLRPDFDALDAYRACMNMGTLTGAPKIMATSLIRRFERRRRGIYGGAIGYYQGDGNLDTCIAIRCARVCDGIAHVQAGAGVVRDSDPTAEAQETVHKARAVLEAIAASQNTRLQVLSETGTTGTETTPQNGRIASERKTDEEGKEA